MNIRVADIGTKSVGRIDIADVSISLGAGDDAFEAVSGLDVAIAPGELVCVLGPSGCGKSTLLGALAGHLPITAAAHGRRPAGPEPEPGPRHGVPAAHAVSLEAGARQCRLRAEDAGRRRGGSATAPPTAILKLVGLSGFEAFYPAQLSGGMQQRVEIARVLINQPRVLLMDEPFGALDAQTRGMMQELLLDIWSKIPTTMVFVTHDIDEALFLADRILVMSARPGRVIEDIVLPSRGRAATIS